MSALREWAASLGSEAHKAVAVSPLGKWKTTTQVYLLSFSCCSLLSKLLAESMGYSFQCRRRRHLSIYEGLWLKNAESKLSSTPFAEEDLLFALRRAFFFVDDFTHFPSTEQWRGK